MSTHQSTSLDIHICSTQYEVTLMSLESKCLLRHCQQFITDYFCLNSDLHWHEMTYKVHILACLHGTQPSTMHDQPLTQNIVVCTDFMLNELTVYMKSSAVLRSICFTRLMACATLFKKYMELKTRKMEIGIR